jgi:N-acetylmuramoyl-L-alanine amidase
VRSVDENVRIDAATTIEFGRMEISGDEAWREADFAMALAGRERRIQDRFRTRGLSVDLTETIDEAHSLQDRVARSGSRAHRDF